MCVVTQEGCALQKQKVSWHEIQKSRCLTCSAVRSPTLYAFWSPAACSRGGTNMVTSAVGSLKTAVMFSGVTSGITSLMRLANSGWGSSSVSRMLSQSASTVKLTSASRTCLSDQTTPFPWRIVHDWSRSTRNPTVGAVRSRVIVTYLQVLALCR